MKPTLSSWVASEVVTTNFRAASDDQIGIIQHIIYGVANTP